MNISQASALHKEYLSENRKTSMYSKNKTKTLQVIAKNSETLEFL